MPARFAGQQARSLMVANKERAQWMAEKRVLPQESRLKWHKLELARPPTFALLHAHKLLAKEESR